jgi:tetratricopeptide (TPR) repeat protein
MHNFISVKISSIAFIVFIIFAHWKVSGQKKDATYFFQKGEDAMDAQNYKTALAHFNECLRIDPYYMEAYYSRAQVREGMGDSKGALTDFSIYLESKPQNTDALFSRAMLRYQYKQWAVAREDFLKLLSAPAGETKSIFFAPDKEGGTAISTTQSNMTATILNYLGMVDTKLKNYKSAAHFLDSAIKLEPKNSEFLINRGWAYQEMLDTVRATSDYQKALALNPEGSLVRHNLASLTAKKGNLKESEKLLTEAIEHNPEEPHFLVARAINYTAQGDYTKALSDYNAAIQLDITDADAWMRRGMIKVKLKDLNGALADYTQSIKLKDNNEKVWLLRGDLMMQLNKIKDAIEDYTVAITHQPDYGVAYYHRGIAKHRSGNLKEACEDLKQAQSLKVNVDEKSMALSCK